MELIFDTYAKSQLTFVQNFAGQAAKQAYIECLNKSNAVEIVQPLLYDIDPVVRMNAVLGLARLAGNSKKCAKKILCADNLLKSLLGQITTENVRMNDDSFKNKYKVPRDNKACSYLKTYKKSCMNLIRNISKHLSCSEMIVKECDGIHAILTCMKDLDVMVREVALQAISSIAGQDPSISQLIIKSGILPQIVQSLKEERHDFKLYALSALSEIAKHNQKLAKQIVDVHTLPNVIIFLSTDYNTDVKLQANTLLLIKNIAKHSLSLTETVVETKLFPEILLLMAHPDESIRYNSAEVVYEVVKYSTQICKMIVTTGGIVSLLNVILKSKEYPSTPAVLALGYISSVSPLLATAVINSKILSGAMNILKQLTAILKSDTDEDSLKAGVAWTLEMIGQHSSKHAKSVFTCHAVNAMIDVYINTSPTHEAHHKCKSAIKVILNKSEDFSAIEKLLTPSMPSQIMLHILIQISQMLPKSLKARRNFIINGHLKMIQNLKPDINSHLDYVIKAVNCCFPDNILQMVAGEIPESVLRKLDKFVPNSQCLLDDQDV
ncbi:sperm-associated antigen 6-like [Aphis craccivora]|uniref:Sperm-associated antigen 6-like n=1 Tax=Aphis craccivora TaxID=307492 RepID=A0A6G0YCX7_APHCR|nr:sperm-associated antigen 6-like [Aphis craccivora]